jgi:hypothetical protein
MIGEDGEMAGWPTMHGRVTDGGTTTTVLGQQYEYCFATRGVTQGTKILSQHCTAEGVTLFGS